MNLLLDTRVLLWWLADDRQLTTHHRELIADGANQVFVSSITVAEVSIKSSLGKLDAPVGLLNLLPGQGMSELAFTGRHAEVLAELPWHHRDPFDRMLVAQAQVEDIAFGTADPRCREYDVRIV